MDDDEPSKAGDGQRPKPLAATLDRRALSARPYALFSTTPAPIRALFSRFPLLTYPANALPSGASSHRRSAPTGRDGGRLPTLYVFATAASPASFNPTCLRWQTWLLARGVSFDVQPSTNHASPSGSLPFLIDWQKGPKAVGAAGLEAWVRERRARGGGGGGGGGRADADADRRRDRGDGNDEEAEEEEEEDTAEHRMRVDAYMVLLEQRIRPAWLSALYLSAANFASVAAPLYIEPTTRSRLVRAVLSHQLRAAARAELGRLSPRHRARGPPERGALYGEAGEAFGALSALLGDDGYFFGAAEPGMLDAAVFGYTHLLLDDDMGWAETGLARRVMDVGALVRHRRRVWRWCFGGARERPAGQGM